MGCLGEGLTRCGELAYICCDCSDAQTFCILSMKYGDGQSTYYTNVSDKSGSYKKLNIDLNFSRAKLAVPS